MRDSKGRFVKGEVSPMAGKKHSEESKEANRKAHLGKTPWNKGLKGVMVAWNKGKSNTWYNPKGLEIGRKLNKGKKLPWLTGDKNPNWKGGKEFWKISDKKHLSSKYMDWMKSVKNRDGWKCKIGNNDCGGRLEAHHILPWRDYPELRYDINNGISLCHYHHPKKYQEHLFVDEFRELVNVI